MSEPIDTARRIAAEVAEHTHWNRHTQARSTIAAAFGLDAIAAELGRLHERHLARGFLDGSDLFRRGEITADLIGELDQLDPSGTTRRLLWELL